MFSPAPPLNAFRHLGKIFPSRPYTASRFSEEHFKEVFAKEIKTARKHDSTMVRKQQPLQLLVLEALFPVWQGYSVELDGTEAENLPTNGGGARDLICNLMRLSQIYSSPDRPKGLGSKSKAGGEYKSEISAQDFARLRVSIEQLFDRSGQTEWVPTTVPHSLSEALLAVTTAEHTFVKAMRDSKFGSEEEANCIACLYELLGKSRGKKAIQALIADLAAAGLKYSSAVDSWEQRSTKRLERQRKMLNPKEVRRATRPRTSAR